jgi:quercetin dioxygenase-like cupin family protein
VRRLAKTELPGLYEKYLPHVRRITIKLDREEIGPLFDEMRSLVPKEGDDYVKIVLVRLSPEHGDRAAIKEHKHPEHAVLYYLHPTGPITIEGSNYQPEKGELLYLPPNVNHAVPRVSEVRMSIAMLVNE